MVQASSWLSGLVPALDAGKPTAPKQRETGPYFKLLCSLLVGVEDDVGHKLDSQCGVLDVYELGEQPRGETGLVPVLLVPQGPWISGRGYEK